MIGFDTFTGFPPEGEASAKAKNAAAHPEILREGWIAGSSQENIQVAAELE